MFSLLYLFTILSILAVLYAASEYLVENYLYEIIEEVME